MDLKRVSILSDVARAAYPDTLHKFTAWKPDDLSEFTGQEFSGFVASNTQMTVVVFRGTVTKLKTIKQLTKSIKEWLIDFDYAQASVNGYRVHSGYNEEFNTLHEKLHKKIRKQYSTKHKRPLFIVGHSAGGALATLAARRLAEDKHDPISADGVYVFSSPRVGDMAFRRNYPVSLHRFERGDDIIPHLPFSPLLAGLAGSAGIDILLRTLQNVVEFLDIDASPKKFASTEVEYVHVGELYYHVEEDEVLLKRSTLAEVMEDVAEDWTKKAVKEFLKAWNITIDEFSDDNEVPKSKIVKVQETQMDVGRVLQIFDNIVNQTQDEKLSFIKDHNLDRITNFIKRLRGKK